MFFWRQQIDIKMVEFVSKNRTYLMGISILLVVLFHAFSWIYNPIGALNIGYVGVDLFMFFSGFGLTFSFEKNKILHFYKNRLSRIYPLYFLAIVITYLVLCHKVWALDDLLYNLLSLGFYTKGGTQRYDWYLESLFTLYLLFPIFYYFSKLKYAALLLTFLLACFVLHQFDVSWWYECFIGRLPIFLYGIMFSKCYKSVKYIGVLGILLYVPCRLYISQFLASSLLVIAIIFMLCFLASILKPSVRNALDVVGKYTLEIYIANLFIYWIFQVYEYNIVERCALYVFVQIIGTYWVVKANQCITRFIQ